MKKLASALITVTILLSLTLLAQAQSRFNPDEMVERVESRPGLDTPKRSGRFNASENNQRFGLQQVGEVSTDIASAPTAPAKPAISQPEIYNNEGQAQLKKNQPERALELFQKALKLQPNLLAARMGLAQAYLQLNDLPSALANYQELVNRDPNNAEAQLNLGVALYRSGRIDEAISQYQVALEKRRSFPSAYFNLAIAEAHAGNLIKAIEHYQAALNERSNYPEACNNLGLIYLAIDDQDGALTQFQQAIKLRNGNYPLAHYNIANLYYNAGKQDAALEELKQAIKQQPDFPEAYLNLGNIYLLKATLAEVTGPEKAKSLLAEAITAFQKAIELREDFYPLAHEALGVALTLQGDKAAAIAQYRIAFNQFEGNAPDTLKNLLLTINGKENFSIGSELSRSDNAGNLKKRANNPATLRLRFNELLAGYQELEDQQKDQPDIRYCAGLAFAAAGEWKAAADEFSRALALSHNQDQEAEKALRAILTLVKYY